MKRIQIMLSACLLLSMMLLSQPSDNPQTFCNPLNLNYRFMVDAVDAREAADPVIVLFKGDYYLFASRSGGYWTSPDLMNWTLIVPTGLDVETYAPAAFVMRDTLFYKPSANRGLYKCGDPKSGIWERGPESGSYGDPAFFLDDDGRLYMYSGLSNNSPIRVVELDPWTFQEIGPMRDVLSAQAGIHGWERRGDDNLLDEQPWIEGSWMVKENGTYYLHYAGPGTEFKTYADGIYTSDSPTGPFTYAEYSPVDFKPTGFICGAGHGCTFIDKDGGYWHIGTMTISIQHMFERRLGLFPVSFDADGQIRCHTEWSDYPQYCPEIQAGDHFAGMLLLSHKKMVTASSWLTDHEVNLAVDEEVRTYWSAATGGTDEWLMVDLGKACSIEAVQINFAEHGTNPDLVRGRDVVLYEQYLLETSSDGLNWDILADKSQNQEDVPHDYIELVQPVQARYVKLTNVYTPGGGNFAVRDLRVFGNFAQAVFTPVNGFTVDRSAADGRDAVIRWDAVEGADGYIIRYGISPEKLYNNYMVYDTDSVAMHSLNHGVEYYFSVEAFDSGTDYYRPAGEFKSSQSGDFDDPAAWAWHDGTDWVAPAPRAPQTDDGIIAVLEGDTITVAAPATADQLVVASGGVLKIAEGSVLTIANSVGADLIVLGEVVNEGDIDSESGAVLNFLNGGTYRHAQDGGTIPAAEWRKDAVCVIDHVVDTAPSNGNQDFYHVLWNCPDQSGNKSMKWNGNVIGGHIMIESTGSGRWQMCAPSSGTGAVVHIKGDIIQSGGQFSSNGTSNANTSIGITQDGNIEVTGGNFSVSRGSQGGTGTTSWILTAGDVSITNATVQNSNPEGASFIFSCHDSSQLLTLSDVTYGGGGFPVQVDSGAVLDMGSSILEGSGKFLLRKGGMLVTALSGGIDDAVHNSGDRTFETGSGFGFNGTDAQVTGSVMPESVSDLLIDNAAGVTLSGNVRINGNLELRAGSVVTGGFTLIYGPDGILTYSGREGQITADTEFPAENGPSSLVVTNERRVDLHASRTVKTVSLLSRLDVGTNSLTAESVSGGTSSEYIDTGDGGKLTLLSVGNAPARFPVGTSSYSPLTITNQGDSDDITVGVVRDGEASPYGGRLKLLWNIAEKTDGGGDYTLEFGWLNAAEDPLFRTDREANSRIFNMSDTTEAGSGDYTVQLIDFPRTVSRSGITVLGPFAVGQFSASSAVEAQAGAGPTRFELFQNYPNPFNPSTKITFTLPEAARVKIMIYDILGNQVALLANGMMESGIHAVRWNADRQASGIYFCRFVTDRYTQTRKMMLMR
ncbi:family 43 glycosylhydrolase [bacterium]|nr:family 43 glycosylhydrolase [bacterium]